MTELRFFSGGRVYRRQQADYHPTTSAKDVVVTTDFEFDDAGRMIIAFAPALALRLMWRLPVIYEAMLKEIASHLVSES